MDQITAKFDSLLVAPMAKKVRASHYAGFWSGFGNASRILFMGIAIYLGLEIAVKKLGVEMLQVILASVLLNFAFLQVGDQASNVPSIAKAKESAIPVFSIIDEKSTLDIRDSTKDTVYDVK